MSWYHEHFRLGPLTIFGANAMHFSWQLRTRWGYLCARPSTFYRRHGSDGGRIGWWRWYVYLSPNGTPWAATFAIGPGLSADEKRGAKQRRQKYGHGFNSDLLARGDDGIWL